MSYQWTPERVAYMRRASEHSDYHRELAALLLPWLTKKTHICDAGCGLGYLSLALAPYVGHVTAVDLSGEALAVLAEKNIPNITIRRGDIASLAPEEPYDAMAFCFFGSPREALDLAGRQCRGDVFLITRNGAAHRFSPGERREKDHGFGPAREELAARGIPFTAKELELEFGQPVASFEDARRFLALYGRGSGPVTEEFLAGKLVKGQGEFPWYLPQRRKFGFLHFRTEDIR